MYNYKIGDIVSFLKNWHIFYGPICTGKSIKNYIVTGIIIETDLIRSKIKCFKTGRIFTIKNDLIKEASNE